MSTINTMLCHVSVKLVVLFAGTHTVYVKTWGCSHNSSDSEYMSGQLSVAGYRVTGKPSIMFRNLCEKFITVHINHSWDKIVS